MCYHKKSQINIVFKAYNSIIKFYDLNIHKKVMFIRLLLYYDFPGTHFPSVTPRKLLNDM